MCGRPFVICIRQGEGNAVSSSIGNVEIFTFTPKCVIEMIIRWQMGRVVPAKVKVLFMLIELYKTDFRELITD